MTLAFSQYLNKIPTYFVEKILQSLRYNDLITQPDYEMLSNEFCFDHNKGEKCQCSNDFKPKIHTIREDNSNRWKAGNLIHFVINNRTPNRYQFAPVLKCVSVQKIIIHYWYNPKTEQFNLPCILIDGTVLTKKAVEQLAINDGFKNTEAFFNYFSKDFKGTIIHWTDKKY